MKDPSIQWGSKAFIKSLQVYCFLESARIFFNMRTKFEKEHKSLRCRCLGMCQIHFFFHDSNCNLLNFNSHNIVIIGYIKILLRAFNINIKDVEDTLHAWKTKSMLKKNVTCDLVKYKNELNHMLHFFKHGFSFPCMQCILRMCNNDIKCT